MICINHQPYSTINDSSKGWLVMLIMVIDHRIIVSTLHNYISVIINGIDNTIMINWICFTITMQLLRLHQSTSQPSRSDLRSLIRRRHGAFRAFGRERHELSRSWHHEVPGAWALGQKNGKRPQEMMTDLAKAQPNLGDSR